MTTSAARERKNLFSPDTQGVVGLLLASGRGRRFDPSGERNKLLALLPDGRPVLRAAAQSLCSALDEVALVLPSKDAALYACVEDLKMRVVRNDRPDQGMSGSIATGVLHFPHARGWVVGLGDMPFIDSLTIRAVARGLHADDSIVAPTYAGQRGHPVAFGKQYFAELCALTGETGARALLTRYPVTQLALNDRGILLDIDTSSDLLR